MTGNIGRRKVRKRKSAGDMAGMRTKIFLCVMILTVFLGYLTARFVIGPIIGYNADESPIKVAEEGEKLNDDKPDAAKKKDTKKEEKQVSGETLKEKDINGYALQFGAFSTKDAAEELSAQLKEKNIKTEIVEADGIYKVISPLVSEKVKAAAELEKIKETEVEDVFIATF